MNKSKCKTYIQHPHKHTYTHIHAEIMLSYTLVSTVVLVGRQVNLYSAYFCSTRKALSHGSHSFICNYTNACLFLVSVHQMARPETEFADI